SLCRDRQGVNSPRGQVRFRVWRQPDPPSLDLAGQTILPLYVWPSSPSRLFGRNWSWSSQHAGLRRLLLHFLRSRPFNCGKALRHLLRRSRRLRTAERAVGCEPRRSGPIVMISLFGKEETKEPGLLERLKASVSKTKAVLAETVDNIFLGERRIDREVLKQLETALLSADLGVKPTREILDSVKEKLDRNALSDASQLKREIKSHIVRILNAPNSSNGNGTSALAGIDGGNTRVIFIFGVKGAGKTTSIGKLANRFRQEGLSVVLCAADTFRAAAIEQLEIWAQRNGIEIVKQKSGADPAAVVYDAVAAA